MDWILSYKPGISKKNLLLIAGFVWLSMSVISISSGMNYIFENSHHILFHLLLGFILGLVLFLLIFLWIFNKYTNRIIQLSSDKPCLFSFSSIKGYFLTTFMFTIGLYLKKYNVFDPLYLSIFYIGIGVSLFFSSLKLFYSFINFKRIVNSKTFSTAS